MNRILVIEDDTDVRSNVIDLLEAEGFEPIGAANGREGIEIAVKQLPSLIICDVGMPGIDGFEVFEILSSRPVTAVIPFIFLSARADRADIRRGMTLGADDYLTKPFTRTELLDSIHARLKRRREISQVAPPPEDRPSRPTPGRVVAHEPSMLALLDQMARVAKSPISVLLLGETGVGKEVLAEEIHGLSGRSGRFVPINCGALPETLLESELFGHEKGSFTGAMKRKEGLFEAAEGGTIFLDEVGELPLSTQVKLLRVLEDRKVLPVGGRAPQPVDVRFVAATNRDVEAEVEAGRFRSDLYYRLNGTTLTVPPLRERPADVEPLVERFIHSACRAAQRATVPRASAETLDVLRTYHWPGNIRELRNVVERAVVLADGDTIQPAHLPPKMTSAKLPNPPSDPRALARADGRSRAAAHRRGARRHRRQPDAGRRAPRHLAPHARDPPRRVRAPATAQAAVIAQPAPHARDCAGACATCA
jgi:DNA-binding NtrC family response regulator